MTPQEAELEALFKMLDYARLEREMKKVLGMGEKREHLAAEELEP